MTTQRKLKEACLYVAKPVRNSCSNCAAFTSEFDYPTWCVTQEDRERYDRNRYPKIEKNMRCADHGFAVKKGAICALWRRKA